MDWSRDGLTAAGLEGFVRFEDLPQASVPQEPGVYVVLRESVAAPEFREMNPAGWFKGKDPTVAPQVLAGVWVHGSAVMYIGKANAGAKGRRGLRKRLDEFRQHGVGKPVGHWGGRYVWQLADSDRLLVAWLRTPDDQAEAREATLISQFVDDFGALPFGNRKRATIRAHRLP